MRARQRPWMELLIHELRTPLSSVKMAVQTLQRNKDLSPRDQRRLAIANREIRTLERMLWLWAEYGRSAPPELERVLLSAWVEDAASAVAPELLERQVQVVVREDAPDIFGMVDKIRITPVVGQLLLNVASGLSAGSTLEITLQKGESQNWLELWDLAAAPPEETARLFEPFGSRLARGMGLSLASLRYVITSAGGDVTVQTTGDKTRYRLSFVP